MQVLTMDVPPWTVALVLAVLAPFAARAIGDAFERRARARTSRSLGLGGVPSNGAVVRPTDAG